MSNDSRQPDAEGEYLHREARNASNAASSKPSPWLSSQALFSAGSRPPSADSALRNSSLMLSCAASACDSEMPRNVRLGTTRKHRSSWCVSSGRYARLRRWRRRPYRARNCANPSAVGPSKPRYEACETTQLMPRHDSAGTESLFSTERRSLWASVPFLLPYSLSSKCDRYGRRMSSSSGCVSSSTHSAFVRQRRSAFASRRMHRI
ncbi:unnamed protein product [Mycena citricolor]|uniref:Uncharacterized protein n=1 Tax=Mycena citricolor TaxID=2018698 RepID=A0AAD2K2Y7_9AGAR|nr:unnamed protein product [Mycena citricolor]